MKKHLFYWLAVVLIIVIGCQKETSFELGDTPATGSLQSDVTGDCLPKTVNGVFVAESPLVPATNSITVSVNVLTTGTYLITTDTVNGYYFRASGTFTTLGVNTVTLRGNGTPFQSEPDNFVVSFNGTICDIAVDVLPVGAGGVAEFTLNGSPTNCTGAMVNGVYATGTALGPTNTVVINVNVTKLGSYTITTTPTPFQGMTFAKSATFTTLGANSVTLIGTGTPTTAGINTMHITVGTTTCGFDVNVASPAVYNITCGSATANGTYTVGVPLTATNTITIPITLTTPGAYGITASVNGMTFSNSGTLAAGATSITLNPVLPCTPTAAGTFSLSVGTPACLIPIIVGAGGSAFTPDCSSAVPSGLYEQGTQLNCSNTVDITINVTGLGPFTISTTATNGMTFSLSGTFTTLGNQTITLVGSGTPTASGPFNIPMPGTTTCTFPLTVDVAPTVDWKFTVTNAPATTYRGQDDQSEITSPSPVGVGILFSYQGSNSLGDDFFTFALNDFNGTIVGGETYTTTANPLTTNVAAFQYDKSGTGSCVDTYTADPSVTGASMTFTVLTNNTTTRVITGTFTGTAKNTAGSVITITSGTFTGTY